MTDSAVIFGAGNIGRGFIGQLFCESGYDVVFVDIDQDLVDALNRRGNYDLQTVFNEEVETVKVGPVRAIHGDDIEAVAQAVRDCSLGATAVGAGALRFIAPAIAAGVAARAATPASPVNLIICENLKGAAAHLRGLVQQRVPEECAGYLAQSVGFVDTVIGRMVPVPTAEMRAQDVSLIRVEPYKELPVDRSGFVGEIPPVANMSAHDNFGVFTARKLYIHNCGHALLAYTGFLRNYAYGYEALVDGAVLDVLRGGLRESVSGIVSAYGADRAWLEEHIEDLLRRFANSALGDTIFRLGRDPVRKLAASDRLTGAANLSLQSGAVPKHLAWGIAAGLLFDPPEDPSAAKIQDVRHCQGDASALETFTGIRPETSLGKQILEYARILDNDHRAEFPD